MTKRPDDYEFEVVEEVVGDLDYFYEEDDDYEGTIKIRRVLLFRNILLGLLAFLFVTTIVGYIQITIYCANEGREATVVTDSYKNRTEYLNTIENNYYDMIDFYSKNDNGIHVGSLINNVTVVCNDNGVEVPYNGNKVSSSATMNFTENRLYTLHELIGNYDNDSDGVLGDYKKVLPKNDETFENLHYALEESLSLCEEILNMVNSSSYKLNVDDQNFKNLLNEFIVSRTALMSAWESANELLKG